MLLFSQGSPQTLYTVATASSSGWNHCCRIITEKLLVVPFLASRIRSSLTVAGSSKTCPCQLGSLPQVCQLLTIYKGCTILLPGRALSRGAISPAWDTKTGPGRDCPTFLGPDSRRTWRTAFVPEEGLRAYWGQWPGGGKKEKQPLFPPRFLSAPQFTQAAPTSPTLQGN